MKCLCKYDWVKLPRDYPDMGKGLMSQWTKLASRAAFRKGIATYCSHENPVESGMWSGGIVGIKKILGVRSREKALAVLDLMLLTLQSLKKHSRRLSKLRVPHGLYATLTQTKAYIP